MSESIVILVLFLVIAAVIIYPIWRRHHQGTTTTTTTLTTVPTGTCFPSTTFPVKSGLIDLRLCNDDVYILGNPAKVKFITISP
jgi:hypothetical protein